MPSTDILIFGEDHNDCTAIAFLVKALLPKGNRLNVKAMRRPIVLSRGAALKKRGKMATEIAGFARGLENVGKKVTVVAHRDCDQVEPAHLDHASQLKADLVEAGVSSAVAAAPAWEIETWWMLFPKAIQEVRPSWRHVDYGSQHVGKFENSKERLTRDLRPTNKAGCRDYHESDGAKIAEMVAKDDSHLISCKARSDSFNLFKEHLLKAVNE